MAREVRLCLWKMDSCLYFVKLIIALSSGEECTYVGLFLDRRPSTRIHDCPFITHWLFQNGAHAETSCCRLMSLERHLSPMIGCLLALRAEVGNVRSLFSVLCILLCVCVLQVVTGTFRVRTFFTALRARCGQYAR